MDNRLPDHLNDTDSLHIRSNADHAEVSSIVHATEQSREDIADLIANTSSTTDIPQGAGSTEAKDGTITKAPAYKQSWYQRILLKKADVTNPESFSNQMRRKRMEKFNDLISDLPKPLRILDIGGTENFWKQMNLADEDSLKIVVGNLNAQPSKHKNIESRELDATDLSSIQPDDFDVVFSNSVIEHLFTFENQQKMASEIQRLGKPYWVQTPNFWFPIEPHFQSIIPYLQGFPKFVRVWLLQRFRFGNRGPYPDVEQARQAVEEIQLLSRAQLTKLFPDASIYAEKCHPFIPIPKSYVAYDGFGKQIEE